MSAVFFESEFMRFPPKPVIQKSIADARLVPIADVLVLVNPRLDNFDIRHELILADTADILSQSQK